MTLIQRRTPQRRRIDGASLALAVLGLVCAAAAYWLIVNRDVNPLILVPSIAAVTTGVTHLVKRVAPRE